ncbi:LysR family transcriptional regulator [Pseudomonas sp. S25]|uniref:LysR family transcriptional regulator n=1 Tax=Pseudomonas maioricensis TaxID=1766623 RepID=A0ABS9ZC91_9PSED|nr:LysR family transcriptional regulator [Pseudomonas sp. S25]MCI8208195.1 LysR family transcriptional regulator [Pseudomonas sp. S25]
MNQRLPIDVLRALLSIVELGSVTRAADSLNLTQSAVSWKIKRLEKQLGRLLIRREGQRLVATSDGAELLVHARRILNSHDEALALFAPSTLEGTVRLGVTEQASLTQLAPILAKFSRQHGNVDVRVVVEQSQALRESLANGTLDLALHQDFAHGLSAEDHLLWAERLNWCVPAGWEYTVDSPVALVTYGPGCFYGNLAQDRLQAAGIRCKVAVQCPSTEGVLSAISAGLGIGVVTASNVDRRVEVSRSFEQRMPLPEVVNVLRYSQRKHEPVLQALQQMLVQALTRVKEELPSPA